jgi:Domain of unknown function (DUF4258)
MSVRLTPHARQRARQRRIALLLVVEVYNEPDDVRPSQAAPDREIRSRAYDDRVIEIVVDLTDDVVVTVWSRAVP